MASRSCESPDVELHESEIAKPQPLRIVKRGQTVTGSSTPREIIGGGRGWSGSSEQSKGSPLFGPDRPLTVHKRRNGRGSVLDGSLEEVPLEMLPLSAISELIKRTAERNATHDDPDITPKARQAARITSAGAFLKSELQRRSIDHEAAGTRSARCSRDSMSLSDLAFSSPFENADSGGQISPKIPQRRFSKSKNFLLKAIGGRSSQEPKHIRRVHSGASRNTLIRRISRSGTRTSDSSTNSIASSSTSCSIGDSQDITDISINSRIPYGDSPVRRGPSISSYTSDSSSGAPSRDVFMLCPQIVVTPELPSVDGGHCTLWAAVEVNGILQRADGHENGREVQRCPSQSLSSKLSNLRHYGRLHSMHIDLIPGQDCIITQIIGNLHETKTIRVSETHLILAKLRLNKIAFSSHIRETSSDELMADLETHLGDTVTPYLTVQLTYQHSGFLSQNSVSLSSEDGTSSHTTRLQTKATASIKRHNPQSAWSPQISQTLNSPLGANPLINLIETYLPSDKAKEALSKLADERVQIPLARRFGNAAGGSSEETVKASGGITARVNSAVAAQLLNELKDSSKPASIPSTIHKSDEPEIDPARKIWAEMRRTSRGTRYRQRRSSINASAYFTVDEDSPCRLSSTSTGVSAASEGNMPQAGKNGDKSPVQEERNRILEVALKNKRSVGTETLRSFAPSTLGKNKGGTIGGLGLGVGRSWGWGPPWW